MADNEKQTKKTFEQMLNIYRDLNAETQGFLKSNEGVLNNAKENLKASQNLANTMEDIAGNKKDTMELSQIQMDLEQQMMIAQAEGNKELVKEIGLAQKLLKIKRLR